MQKVGNLIKKSKLLNNVINVNKNISINDNGNNGEDVNKRSRYALDPSKFTPNNQESQLAEEIAKWFDDVQNYAFYLHVVKRLGHSGAYTFWRALQMEVKEKYGTAHAIISPKKYFAWKFKRGLTY